jgi:hypothetical protein
MVSIEEKIAALMPGERVHYGIKKDGAKVLAIASMDKTIELTQQRYEKIGTNRDGDYYSYIYYVNRISDKAADILEDLKDGPDIFSCFWVREKLTSD